MSDVELRRQNGFLSTPSARRATREHYPFTVFDLTFLSTPSARRATWYTKIWGGGFQFLSTPSARRATCHNKLLPGLHNISIHALREEGDRTTKTAFATSRNFYPRPPRGGRRRPLRLHPPHTHISIHALREEGDICHQVGSLIYVISIHALREEGDIIAYRYGICQSYFYPRPPRGGRPRQLHR